ncbi:MAG: hypothetical protein OEW45_16445 [Deltaproteobacteria bacterium]|nr:hypothetical protein [Deltaproteobacteria bacterium]
MKKIFSVFSAILLACLMVSPALAASDLGVFISNLNVQAQADLGAFKVRLSTQFGVPAARVEAVMASVKTPGDAYMCFRVGQVASKPVEVVTKEYQRNKAKGWGVIAKNLGIKPGSKEFHELKKGNFDGDDSKSSKGKGKGKGKGKK